MKKMREVMPHLNINLLPLDGVSYVARTHDVDAEAQDVPVHDDDHRERTPLRRADGLLEFLDVAEQRQRAPCAVRDTAGQHFCAVGQFPNLEGEDDGGMRAGRRRKDARSILAVNRVERADVKTAARTSRPSPLGRYSVEERAVRTRPRI
jgi:hypothetical protein